MTPAPANGSGRVASFPSAPGKSEPERWRALRSREPPPAAGTHPGSPSSFRSRAVISKYSFRGKATLRMWKSFLLSPTHPKQ
jgi:hypothetical protein